MKKKFGLEIKAPVTLVFGIISVVLFALNFWAAKGKWTELFLMSPAAEGNLAFSFKGAASYFRILCYSFSAVSWEVLITNILFVYLLGPAMEEKYGSVILAIMMLVAAVFSGVLNSCFCKAGIQGCASIIYLLVFISFFTSFTNRKLSINFVLILALFIAREFLIKNPNGIAGVGVNFAGGICGSLLAFLAIPRRKKNKTEDVETSTFVKSKKSEEKSRKKNDESSEETVVGTLYF